MRNLPVRISLPGNMLKEIGQFITLYSFYEYALLRTIYHTLGVSQKHGRIAVREIRGQDQVDMLASLLTLSGLEHPVDMKNLATLTKKINTERDRLAHCVWIIDKNPKRYFALNTKGTRTLGGEKVLRKIKPEGLQYDLAYLRKLRRSTRNLCQIGANIFKDVARQVAKQQKARTQQSARKGPPEGRNSAKQKPPQQL